MTKPIRSLPYAVSLIMAGLLAYAGSFAGPFVYDGLEAIANNPELASFSDSLTPPQDTTIAGRPVLSLSFWLNHAMGGLDVVGYHAFNLAFHILAGLFLFGIARRVLASEAMGKRTRAAAGNLALCIAAAWLLHPLQTQSVTYIVQRAESLMGMFFLATVYCSLRAFEGPRAGAWTAGAIVASALGMATKEVMVVVPLVVLVLDWTMRSGSLREKLAANRALYGGLFATWLVLGACLATAPRMQSVGMDLHIAPLTYLITQAGVLSYYLRLTIVPEPQSFDYYDWPIAAGVGDVLFQALFIAVLLGVSIWALIKRQPIGLLGALFFLVLAPTSSVLPIVTEIAAEHRMYLPLIAPIALLVCAVHAFLAQRSLSQLGAPLAIVLILTLGFLTRQRNLVYANAIDLWQDVIDSRPNNARAHNSLGLALHDVGRLDEALVHCESATALAPEDPDNHLNLGTVHNSLGHAAVAEKWLRGGTEMSPDDPAMWSALGAAIAQQGRADEAFEALTRALELDPTTTGLQANLSAVHLMRGEFPEAVACGRKAVAHNPGNAQARHNLGQALSRVDDLDGAIEQFSRAAELEPDKPRRHRTLAEALMQAGNLQDAVICYRDALTLTFNADDANLVARILSTHPDAAVRNGAQAVALAERMVREGGENDPMLLDTLGTAYAEVGRFDDAIRTAEKALTLPLPQGMEALAVGIQERLELYRTGRAYRF